MMYVTTTRRRVWGVSPPSVSIVTQISAPLLQSTSNATRTSSMTGHTNTNELIASLERLLKRPLQWIVCLLQGVKLALRHVFTALDGTTTSPDSFSGPIAEVLNLFCIFYLLLIEKSIIHPQSNTFTFLILKIEVCFSLYFRHITPSVSKIYPQGVNLLPVKNP